MSKDWFINNNHELGYWYETPHYPKDCKTELFCDEHYDCGFDVYKQSTVYNKYLESNFSGSYVEYLESLVDKHEKKLALLEGVYQ
jgi:hypothetical protein